MVVFGGAGGVLGALGGLLGGSRESPGESRGSVLRKIGASKSESEPKSRNVTKHGKIL